MTEMCIIPKQVTQSHVEQNTNLFDTENTILTCNGGECDANATIVYVILIESQITVRQCPWC